jgi:hypothetical protein
MELFEGQLSGVLSRSVTVPTITREGSQLEISTDLDFEQILLPLLSGVKGGVTPTTPAGEARLWTFAPSQTAPSMDSYTLEFVVDDGSTKQNVEAPYGITTGFEITGGVDAVPQISWSMDARKSSDSTYTSGLSLPTVSYASNLKWTVFCNDTWADMEGSASKVPGQVYGFTWALTPLVMPQFYLDGRDDLDFSTVEPQTRQVDLTMQVVYNTGASDFVEEQMGKKDNSQKQFLSLELIGANFTGAASAYNRSIKLRGSFVHASDSMEEIGGDRDGNSVTTMHLLSQYDPTEAGDIEILIQNSLTSFP